MTQTPFGTLWHVVGTRLALREVIQCLPAESQLTVSTVLPCRKELPR